MSNDFKSLLSNFRQATNNASESVHVESSNNTSTTIQDSISQFWRVTQLRRATTIRNKNIGNTSNDQTIHFHLAICICIIDSLVHEPLWRDFIDDGAISTHNIQTLPSITLSTSAEIYIHAKYPEKIQSPWVRTKTISTTYRPSWNDVRIIRAMLALATEALKDHRTTHLIFVTETCIPIATLKDVATSVVIIPNPSQTIQLNQSFICAYNSDSPSCTRFDERECFSSLYKYFPQEVLYKALPGWCLLSRLHIQSILDLPSLILNTTSTTQQQSEEKYNLWSLFQNVWAPEEVYFATCLALLGFLPCEHAVSKSLMFACWDKHAKNHSDRAHPRSYDHELSKSLVQDLRKSGYMFMRKLKNHIALESWRYYINDDESTESGPSLKKIRTSAP